MWVLKGWYPGECWKADIQVSVERLISRWMLNRWWLGNVTRQVMEEDEPGECQNPDVTRQVVEEDEPGECWNADDLVMWPEVVEEAEPGECWNADDLLMWPDRWLGDLIRHRQASGSCLQLVAEARPDGFSNCGDLTCDTRCFELPVFSLWQKLNQMALETVVTWQDARCW